MKRTIGIFIVCLLLLSLFIPLYFIDVPSASASGEAWLLGWSYRKSHIVEYSAGAGSNYTTQPIVVYNATGTDSGSNVYVYNLTRSDFGDIRWTDDDGSTELYYYQPTELTFNGYNATFYVTVLDSLSTANVTIYMYYGKSDATTQSSLSDTFISELDGARFATDMTLIEGENLAENSTLEFVKYMNDGYSDDYGNRSMPWGFGQWGSATDMNYTVDNTTSHSGTYSMKFYAPTESVYMAFLPEAAYWVNATAADTYDVTAWAKTSGTQGYGVTCGISFFNSTQHEILYVGGTYFGLGTADWQKISFSYTAPPTTVNLTPRIIFYGNGTAWIDDIQVNQTRINDYSGYDNDITFLGASSTEEPMPYEISDGKYGDAINYTNPLNVEQRVLDDDNSLYTANAFTWSAWVRLEKDSWGAGEEWATIFSKAYFWEEYWFALYSNTPTIHARFDSNTYAGYSSGTLSKDTWQLATVTWNGTHVLYYRNGAYDTYGSYSGTMDDYSGSMYFGTPVSGYHFEGGLDNIFILDNAITGANVSLLYSNYGDVTIKEGSVVIRKYVSPEPENGDWGNQESSLRLVLLVIKGDGSVYCNSTLGSNGTVYAYDMYDVLNFTAVPDVDTVFANYTYNDGADLSYDNPLYYTINATDTLICYFVEVPFPLYSDISYSGDKYGQTETFSCRWTDTIYVDGTIYGDNSTGSFTNRTWASTGMSNNYLAQETVTLPAKLNVVAFQWWANNSLNNWNTTGTQYMTTHGYNVTFTFNSYGQLGINGTYYLEDQEYTDQDYGTVYEYVAVPDQGCSLGYIEIDGIRGNDNPSNITLDDDHDLVFMFYLYSGELLDLDATLLVAVMAFIIAIIPLSLFMVQKRKSKREAQERDKVIKFL